MTDDRLVRILESDSVEPGANVVARLHGSADTYEIEALEGHPVWVNGVRVDSKQLEHRDLIELGETGPLTRFQLYSKERPARMSIADILSDGIDYARVSRKPVGKRLTAAFGDVFKNLTLRTTVLFRLSVVVAILALVATSYVQWRSNIRLQQQVQSDAVRLEEIATALSRTRQEALSSSDLNTLQQKLRRQLSVAAERLETLERRSTASSRVIASAMPSIVFLQGAYGFRNKESGDMLRYSVNEEGRPLLSPRGQPLLTLEGDGPVVERQFTGTAFVITKTGVLLTNRHVAVPWENDVGIKAMEKQSLAPVLIKFIGYLPDIAEPFEVELLGTAESVDLALLLCSGITGSVPSLSLSTAPPEPGDGVIVMGYPTGLKSMLAQTGSAFIDELRAGDDIGFWTVAAKLAERQFIHPLASRGIVGRVTGATVVYDAETTHGGSGGPVLNMNGEVIAVNTAIIPEYGGSNFGVPVTYAQQLLADAEVP